MNQTLNSIFTRTSCRAFLDKEVEDEKLELIIKAGVSAPTAINKQSPIILAVKNKELINELVEEGKKYRNGADCFYGAKIILIVLADSETHEPIKDGSCVLENMFIAANSLGLGSCWINTVKDILDPKNSNSKALRAKFNLDDKYIPVGSCIIGYPLKEGIVKEHKADYVRKFY